MLLKELEPGNNFMFEDRNTPLALITVRGRHPADGTFQLVRFGEAGCPVLRHLTSGKEITVVANTAYRWVLRIF